MPVPPPETIDQTAERLAREELMAQGFDGETIREELPRVTAMWKRIVELRERVMAMVRDELARDARGLAREEAIRAGGEAGVMVSQAFEPAAAQGSAVTDAELLDAIRQALALTADRHRR